MIESKQLNHTEGRGRVFWYLDYAAVKVRKRLYVTAGIVHARPGKNGGYSLAKDASEISMLDIFNALQNDRLRAERKEAEDASDLLQDITAACSAVEREMEEYMSSITLQNMIERIHGKESDTASGSTRSQTPA